MRYAQALARYQRQLRADGCSAHTRAAYFRDLRALSRWLGSDPAVGKITPDTLARFLASDEALQTPDGHPRAAITVNRTKSALRSFFAFCVASGWVRENPTRLIRSSPARPKEPATLEPGEIDRLRTVLAAKTGSLAARDRLILELLLGTGIRLGSLVGLDIGDIDLQSGTIRIHAKGGAEERVFLNPRLVGMLGGFLHESRSQGPCGPHSPLIRSQSGRRLGARAIHLKFARWVGEAGIDRPVSVHSLRHTFATRLYEKTGDLYLVQRALGHRQITTTEIYARVSENTLRRAVQTM
ncbi:MAG TPA: tyrosine-type recombinase/integrase [Phycisphaerae bacterium]|nr:tyrosine-type recombinase/integrase [Phycisphaerae bacterium]